MPLSRAAARSAAIVPIAALAAFACGPIHDGPILRDPPDGLGYTTSVQSARLPLPHRKAVRQICYGNMMASDTPDLVVITVYSGAADRAEAAAARDEYAKRYNSTSYGPVEDVRIDGHAAWGWFETQQFKGTIWSRQYTAIVPWGSSTYSIEYSAHKPETIDEANLRKTVLSFTVASKTPSLVFGWAVIGAIAIGVLAFIRKTGTMRPKHE